MFAEELLWKDLKLLAILRFQNLLPLICASEAPDSWPSSLRTVGKCRAVERIAQSEET
jgi:hypothetical protein